MVVLDETLPLPDGCRVYVAPVASNADKILRLARDVYAGLSLEEVEEIERTALDRRSFAGGRFVDRERT